MQHAIFGAPRKIKMRYLFTSLLAITLFIASAQTPVERENKIDRERVIAHRAELNREFSDSLISPLLKERVADFEGLEYFDFDPKYIVEAKYVVNKKQKKFRMKTSTERRPEYMKYAKVKFELKGEKYVLNVYQSQASIEVEEYKDYLFIPFTDLTNGESTYGGGRYLDIKMPEGESVTLDLNLAYNPYCAYSHRYSCPIVPLENHVPTRVEAGVKKYHE